MPFFLAVEWSVAQPVYLAHRDFSRCQHLFRANNNPARIDVELHDIERLVQATDAEAPALADRVVDDTPVGAEHTTVGMHDLARIIPVRDINWLGDGAFEAGEREVSVRVRSTRPPAPAVIRPVSSTEAEVELLSPEQGVSPGQACVFYETGGTRVLGGGWIWRGA